MKEHNHTMRTVSFVKNLITTIVVVIMSFALNAANTQWWSKIARPEELRETSHVRCQYCPDFNGRGAMYSSVKCTK